MFTTSAKTPGIYRRPLGGAESMMAGVVGVDAPLPREPLQIHCYADFKASTSPQKVTDAFRIAWKALRLLKTPDIATSLTNGNKFYKIPNDQEIESWLESTFVLTPEGTSLDDAIKEMHQRPEWLPVLYLLPQSTAESNFQGTLVLFISHWRTEASGTFLMLDQLFEYASDILTGSATLQALADHKIGDEVQLLTPALEDIAMPERESTAESKERVERLFQTHDGAQPTVEIDHLGDFTQAPANLHWTQRIYSTSSTSAVVVACKAKGLSVTAAVHSAYLGAIWDLAADDQKSRSYASVWPVEMRRRLPSSSLYRNNGGWNAAQMLVLIVPAGQDFAGRAKSLREQYLRGNSDTWLYEDMRATTERLMQPSANYPPKPKALPYITSFGVLDNNIIQPTHGPFTIHDVGGWADNTGPGIVLTIWTFRGRLTLQITRNEAFHGDAQIEEILERMDRELGDGLGVEMFVDEVKSGEN